MNGDPYRDVRTALHALQHQWFRARAAVSAAKETLDPQCFLCVASDRSERARYAAHGLLAGDHGIPVIPASMQQAH